MIKRFKFSRLLLSCGMCVFMFSCNNDTEIKVYRLAKKDPYAKESPIPLNDANQNLPISEVSSAKITWKTPDNWQEQPAKGMRFGSFNAQGGVDISVIFLEGNGGGDLENINRWRQQIALSPLKSNELESYTQYMSTPLGDGKLVDFTADSTISSKDHQKRLLAALVPYKHGTWFFKMTGEHALVEEQKPLFIHFLSSVQEGF